MTKKTPILIEALPYIKKFRNKIFVIKYGGSMLKNNKAKKAFIEDVALLTLVGIKIVIVHGGGIHISDMLAKLDMGTEFVEGLRRTDKNTVEIVQMVLSGGVNKEITLELCKHGISAVGISGIDDNLISADKKYVEKNGKKFDIGYVGEVVSLNNKLLKDLINNSYLPVISPIGQDNDGNIYNINADYVAAAVSTAMKAEKLIVITDVKGIYKDINDKSSFISSIDIEEIERYIKNGIIKEGMIPKMECCIEAIKGGTKNIHLIDGRRDHSLLFEIFTSEGIGTMIKGGENYEKK